MLLTSITELSEDQQLEYTQLMNGLRERFGRKDLRLSDVCEGPYESIPGYAERKYHGTLKEGIELSELELSMMCDNGFSHFGGSSRIQGRTFNVTIYVD